MRLLLVEDSARLQELLTETLKAAGYVVDIVGSVRAFRALPPEAVYSLYIVDLGLPDGDGLEIVNALRSNRIAVPILVTTGRAAVDHRIAGLDTGADDYLAKPFHHGELLARVRALLRRLPARVEEEISYGPFTLHLTSQNITCSGLRFNVRASERRLLSLLIRKQGATASRSEIELVLYGSDRLVSANAVEAIVSRLRRTLADAHSRMELVTVRGVGYCLRPILQTSYDWLT